MSHLLARRQRTTSWLLLVFHFHYLDQILFLFSLSLIAWTGSLVVWLCATGLLLVVTTGCLTAVLVTLENGLGGSECLPFLSFKELFSGSLFLDKRFLVPWKGMFPLGNVDPRLIGRFIEFELRRIWCSVSFIVSSLMQRFPSSGVALTVGSRLSLETYCCSCSLSLSSSSLTWNQHF